MEVRELSTEEFKREVEDSQDRVVVEFYADWCGPCRQVAPELEELASKWGSSVRFVKINIDDNRELAESYAVLSIPSIMLFEGGRVTAMTKGVLPARVIERELQLDASHAA